MKTYVECVFGEDDKHTCSVRPCSSCAPPTPRTGPPRARATRPSSSGCSSGSSCNKGRNTTTITKRDRPTIHTLACPLLPHTKNVHRTVLDRTHPERKAKKTMRCVLSEFSQGLPVLGLSGLVKKPVTVDLWWCFSDTTHDQETGSGVTLPREPALQVPVRWTSAALHKPNVLVSLHRHTKTQRDRADVSCQNINTDKAGPAAKLSSSS